jgi:hypothetical protein
MHGMAKYEMRVIPEPAEGTRYVAQSEHAGSMSIKGYDGDWTFLCGNCRDILVKNVSPDADIVHEYDGHDRFTPVATVAEMVFRCKGCGAFNEVDQTVLGGSQSVRPAED